MFTIAPHYQIMAQLDLKDSSRYLHANCLIDFFSYLILHICLQIFNVMDKKNCFGN